MEIHLWFKHWNSSDWHWFCPRHISGLSSKPWSPQSLIPSQTQVLGMQRPELLHWNSKSSTHWCKGQVIGSSEKSSQSGVPSHFQDFGIQSPFKHLNSRSFLHANEQFLSSEDFKPLIPSWQSSSRSQIQALKK